MSNTNLCIGSFLPAGSRTLWPICSQCWCPPPALSPGGPYTRGPSWPEQTTPSPTPGPHGETRVSPLAFQWKCRHAAQHLFKYWTRETLPWLFQWHWQTLRSTWSSVSGWWEGSSRHYSESGLWAPPSALGRASDLKTKHQNKLLLQNFLQPLTFLTDSHGEQF